ncbi:MAG: hypothetical protein VKK07_00875 [Merismopediaceae bacterium]|nr:hypothetical protein [Merismopediaceae bacterium]
MNHKNNAIDENLPSTFSQNTKNFSKSLQYQFSVGAFLAFLTIGLVTFVSLQNNNAAKYVASFVAGLFGFTAIEVLRSSVKDAQRHDVKKDF